MQTNSHSFFLVMNRVACFVVFMDVPCMSEYTVIQTDLVTFCKTWFDLKHENNGVKESVESYEGR